MSNAVDIKRLYSTILFDAIRSNYVRDEDIKAAIENMSQVYKPDAQSLSSETRRLADYNALAHRCAYLHKYAPFHTAMVGDILKRILCERQDLFWTFEQLLARRHKFKICSLGGGPGSDIVGVIGALSHMFGVFPCSAKVVDVKSHWRATLKYVIQELRYGEYGIMNHCFHSEIFDWEYLTADLLDEVQDDVKAAIGKAELLTMVKFVSAAACLSTEAMLVKIFMMLKPGCMVLFIDNAAGGYRQLVSKAAEKCKLKYVFGPINHENYINEYFNFSYWNYSSCFSTTVTIHMMQKLYPLPNRNNNGAKNIVPNKRFKSDESCKLLQVQNMNVPQSSACEKPEKNRQAGDGELNQAQVQVLDDEINAVVSELLNNLTSKEFAGLNSPNPCFTERPNDKNYLASKLNSEILTPINHNNRQFSVIDCKPIEAYENVPTCRSSADNGNPTSIAPDSLSIQHINGNTVCNSAEKANNEQVIITNNTSAADHLSMKNRLSIGKSKNNSSLIVDSASTDINSQPKAENENRRIRNYGAINSLKPMNKKVNSAGNDLPSTSRLRKRKSFEQCDAVIDPAICGSSVNYSEMDKENYFKKNESPSTERLQDSFNSSILQETPEDNCCSSCAVS